MAHLFLGLETSCSEPRIFFEPRDIFFCSSVLFSISVEEMHTKRTHGDETKSNQKFGKFENKDQARYIKTRSFHPFFGCVLHSFFVYLEHVDFS